MAGTTKVDLQPEIGSVELAQRVTLTTFQVWADDNDEKVA